MINVENDGGKQGRFDRKMLERTFVVIRPESPLLSKIKIFKKRTSDIREHLALYPQEWGRFQSEFNQEINGIFRDIMIFERENKLNGLDFKINKFKSFFREKLEKDFSCGDYITWSQKKPYGYAGDFKMMSDIYDNNPKTLGYERLFDNYMQMSAIAVAVRNRKDDFRSFINEFILKRKGKPLKIMSLACGPCRELEELSTVGKLSLRNIWFDCVDNDLNALDFSAERLNHHASFNFIRFNAVRMALKKDIINEFPHKYDLIYSTGLFDYLNDRVSVRLIQNLKKLLNPGGVLAVSDVQDEFSNPSLHFMQLVGKWDLLYRQHDNFRGLFVEAGYSQEQLSCGYEQQGIMQYIFALNNV